MLLHIDDVFRIHWLIRLAFKMVNLLVGVEDEERLAVLVLAVIVVLLLDLGSVFVVYF